MAGGLTDHIQGATDTLPEFKDSWNFFQNVGHTKLNDAECPNFSGGPIRECNMELRKGNLVAKALKEKCINADIKVLVASIVSLGEIWEKCYVCYERPEKYH